MGCVVPPMAPPSPRLAIGNRSSAGFYFGDYRVHVMKPHVALETGWFLGESAFVIHSSVWCMRSSSLFLSNSVHCVDGPVSPLTRLKGSWVVSSFLMMLSRAAGNRCVQVFV